MKFLVSWTLPHGEAYRAAVARFLETGGSPPAGAQLIGRWHGLQWQGLPYRGKRRSEGHLPLDGGVGVKFMAIDATPLVEDADGAAVFQSLYG